MFSMFVPYNTAWGIWKLILLLQVTEDEGSSPVDMAKLYMKARPLWASPSFKQEELKSPSSINAQLFVEETPGSLGGNVVSSSKVPFKYFNTFYISQKLEENVLISIKWGGSRFHRWDFYFDKVNVESCYPSGQEFFDGQILTES